MEWCTIESDPGVFTELIEKIGVKNVQVNEILGLDDIENVKPCYGLIFLFQWQKSEREDTRKVLSPDRCPNVFFAKQIVNNACATQAIINVLMNKKDMDLGNDLKNFKDFASFLPPDDRGISIGNMDNVRKAHNSFARQEPFDFIPDNEKKASSDEVYHFVAYTPVNGQLYELDGLKDGPILLGDCKDDDWLGKARAAIEDRMARFQQAATLNYNLLALIPNQKVAIISKLNELEDKLLALKAAGTAESDTKVKELEGDIAQTQAMYDGECSTRDAWKSENIRRRHDYVPLIFSLCKALAKEKKLLPLVGQAEEVTKKKREAEANRKKAAKEAKDKREADAKAAGPSN